MIGIIFISDIIYCPYLNKYTQVLDSQKINYEVLFWNREEVEEEYPSNYIHYNLKSEKKRSPIFKILDFIKYRNWLIKKIDKKKYKKLIILSTLSGILITDILLKKYKNKYIFDIRDYSYENLSFFYKIEKKIIENSYFTCISSDGFKNFLPRNQEYLVVHNFDKKEIINQKKFTKKNKNETLNLIFIGGVRYFDHQKNIINKLKNDDRFKMIYHGSGIELDNFIEYCEKNNIKNISFTGKYDNKEKYRLLASADLLNNSYKTGKIMEVKYAISNKYYDGLIYGIPQLVETETYKQKKVETLHLGKGLNEKDPLFAEHLYDYYHSINDDEFDKSCKEELSKIIEEDTKYVQAIKNFSKK